MKVEEMIEMIVQQQEERVTMPPLTSAVAEQIRRLRAMKNKKYILESTNEEISEVLCPFCDSEIVVDYALATENDRLYIEYHCSRDGCELSKERSCKDSIVCERGGGDEPRNKNRYREVRKEKWKLQI